MDRGWSQILRLRLFAVSCLLCSLAVFLISCSAKKVAMPSYEGIELKDVLEEKGNIRSLKSTFTVAFDGNGNFGRGDAVLNLTPEDLDLQVYSHGFLVAEVASNKDFTKSVPALDSKRLSMLVDGLRNSFLWWTVKDYDIEDRADDYRVSNPWRILTINKKTMLPDRQFLELEDGKQIEVLYAEPEFVDGIWFPTEMHIGMGSKSVSIKVKTLSVNN